MADSSNIAAAAQPQAPEVVPTPLASSTAPGAAPSVALSLDDFLDGGSLPGEPAEKSTSGTGASPSAEAHSPETKTETAAPAGAAAKDANAETTTDEVVDEAEDPEAAEAREEQETQELLEQSKKDGKPPEWWQGRIDKLTRQKHEAREDAAAKAARIAELEADLAKAVDSVKAPQPSSLLGKFDSPEALEAEHQSVLNFLAFAESEAAKELLANDTTGAQESRMAHSKAYSLQFLQEHQKHQEATARRAEQSKTVRASVPALFDGKSAESRFRSELYAADPRLRADWDQVIADAAVGRKLREDKVSSADRTAAAAKAAAERAAQARAAKAKVNGNGSHKPGTPPPLPATPSAARSPVHGTDVASAKESVITKARTAPVSMDEMADAGALT